MTSDQFRMACQEIDLKYAARDDGARNVLGICRKHASRIATGKVPVSPTLALLLEALVQLKDHGIPINTGD